VRADIDTDDNVLSAISLVDEAYRLRKARWSCAPWQYIMRDKDKEAGKGRGSLEQYLRFALLAEDTCSFCLCTTTTWSGRRT
jgi:hypothetical protein